MKPISILKRLITIYYYFLAISIVASIITVFLKLINGNINDLKIQFLDLQLDFSSISNLNIALTIVFATLLYFLFFQAIYYIKSSVNALESGNYYSELVIKNFKKTGILFLILSVGVFIGKIIFSFLINSELKLDLDSSVFIFIIMGLFLMFLSEVFLKAKTMQQENDLTI